MKVILFGPPGVGKSTVGELFAQNCGLAFYDGDSDYTPQEKQLISSGEWNDTHRRLFLERISSRIQELDSRTGQGVLVPIAMTKQWMRDLFDQLLGSVHWVLVKPEISRTDLEAKITARSKEGHMISPDTFRRLTEQFEAPSMPHLVLENPHDSRGRDRLARNISALWEQINPNSKI